VLSNKLVNSLKFLGEFENPFYKNGSQKNI